MTIGYKNNWRLHFFALLNGKGFSEELARDLWTNREDLWESAAQVSYRWPKLLLVYLLSVLTQMLLPGFVVCGLIIAVQGGSLRNVFVALVIMAIFGVPYAIVRATVSYVHIRNKRKRL